jgi:hypothetical protein
MGPKTWASFPRDLLDGSSESVRMAERIVRQLGFEDYEADPPSLPAERLAWALRAMEAEDEGEGSGGRV